MASASHPETKDSERPGHHLAHVAEALFSDRGKEIAEADLTDAAERQRRSRELKAAGKIPLRLALSEDNLVVALIEARLLHPNDADDREKIAAAAERYFEAAIADVTV